MKLLAVRRLLRIQRVVIRYRLDDLILELPMLPWWLRLLGATLPWRWLPRRKLELTRGARLRLALQDLGPIFIKFGQILSTRRDLLPDDIANELAWLQDKVPPFRQSWRSSASRNSWARRSNRSSPASNANRWPPPRWPRSTPRA